MIDYRTFLNCDPPAIAEIWCRQTAHRSLLQPMTSTIVDQFVLAKPYFDRDGLILAWEGDRPVGFVHAGFRVDQQRQGFDERQGITCLLMVVPHQKRDEIARELLLRSEAYLRRRGAQRLYGGSPDPWDAFYLGLYGGSGSPGVLNDDQPAMEAYRALGYEEMTETLIWQCDLSSFRPPVDRHLIQLKRELEVRPIADVLPSNWWEAWTFAQLERTQFQACSRREPSVRARADVWDVEPLASSWGIHAAGLLNMATVHRAEGPEPSEDEQRWLHVFLLSETMRQLRGWGVTMMEAQLDRDDLFGQSVCRTLGFEEMGRATRFVKAVRSD